MAVCFSLVSMVGEAIGSDNEFVAKLWMSSFSANAGICKM